MPDLQVFRARAATSGVEQLPVLKLKLLLASTWPGNIYIIIRIYSTRQVADIYIITPLWIAITANSDWGLYSLSFTESQ